MQYKKFGNTYVIRMDMGEKIVENIMLFAKSENVKLASVQALGAIGELTIGVYKPNEKQYISKTFKGDYEITSLTGTITQKDLAPYVHLHISVGAEGGLVYGGHLNEAIVSATVEMIVSVIDGKVGRKFNEEIGLNLFDFE